MDEKNLQAHARPACRQAGFTLIETAVWIAVLTFAMIALSDSLISFYRTNASALSESSAIASGEHGIDTAVKAIRTASYSSNGEYPIVSIAPNQMIFYANVTPNDNEIQEVRLFVASTSLSEGIIEPSGDPASYGSTETVSDLADYIQNITVGTSTFTYYDASGTPIADESKFADVRFVTVTLVVDTSTTSIPNALTLQSSAALRNLIGN